MVDEFYATRTREQADYLSTARDRASPARMSPYPSSVASLARGFLDVGSRQRICARPPDELWHCDPFMVPAPASPAAPYTITEEARGVMRLAIGDLSNGADPAWSRFDADLAPLANAKAIVLDLREATGGDPRPLLPWLERVTGRRPLRPLRSIHRPATADPYVVAYAARFTSDGRDRAVWAPLVGTMPATTTPPTRARIAVVISPRCGAACELAARVLETHAGAIVLGNPAHYLSRLHRDEPALLVLPRSAVEIYFYATEYLLSRDIEAKTGTTGEWNAFAGEGFDGDLVAAAVRELTEPRLARRCTAYPAYTTRAAMPPAAAAKLHGHASSLRPGGCSDGVEVTLHSDMPLSSLHRFAATCSQPPDLTHYVNDVFSIGNPSYPVLTQLAQSDLVKAIYIGCSHRPTIR
jgi:hypothetical protein